MPWKGVTVSEQRDRFLEDYLLNCYTITDLADRFGISRNTAHRWIARFLEAGRAGYHELSRRPNSCPWQTDPHVAELLIDLRRKHPRWGPRKLLDILQRRHPSWDLPAPSTVARLFSRNGLAHRPQRFRRAHPGCPQTVANYPNDIWAADYKGQFRLGNSHYCFPLTISDLASRYLLGCDAHPEVSLERTQAYFSRLFHTYGLPNRIRTDNGIPFASNALARLSQLSVWFIKLGIYPELIEPGKPQQNASHE
jgi:transposase InsO family protein